MKISAPMTMKARLDSARVRFSAAGTVAAAAFVPMLAWAADTSSPSFTDTGTKVCGFFNNVNGILNMTSVLVITAAVIIAGYQIAFAHKRIADVAPILIGGVLIGAASQIAKMLIGDQGSCGAGTSE